MAENNNGLAGITFDSMFRDEPIETPAPDATKIVETPETVVPPVNQDPPVVTPDEPIVETEDEQSLFEQLNQDFGLEIEDEFQEDYEGIKGYVMKSTAKLAEKQLNDLFEKFPDAADFLDHLLNGGDSKSYFEIKTTSFDYSNIELSPEDDVLNERILVAKLRDDGYDEADVKDRVESYKSAALLHKEAESALKILKKRDELKIQSKQESEQAKRLAEQREYENTVADITGSIKKGVLQNIQIPEKEKKEFTDFIFKPVTKDGLTQRDLVRQKLTTEQKIELEYLVYKGLKLDDLILAKKQTKDLAHLRKASDKEIQTNLRKGSQQVAKPVNALPDGYNINDIL